MVLLLVASLLVSCTLYATLADAALTNKVSYTVAGIPGTVGDVNGYPGQSLLMNPAALCTSLLESNQLLMGTKNALRTLRTTTWETENWFGRAPGSGVPTTGSIGTVSLTNPYGCVAAPSLGSVFFVQSDGNVYSLINSQTVQLFTVQASLSFVDVDFYDGYVYILSVTQKLYKCEVSPSSHAVIGCTEIVLDGVTANGVGQVGLAVSSSGVIVATGDALKHFDFSGAMISSANIPAVDVHFMQKSTGQPLVAATSTALYTVSGAASSSSLSVQLLAGDPSGSTNCVTTTDYDKDITFCRIYRIFPISYAAIYLTTPALATTRILSYPDVKIPIVIDVPFPVNMTDAEGDMSTIYDGMDQAIKDALEGSGVNPDYVQVNRSEVEVNHNKSSWTTTITVNVPQEDYPGKGLDGVIQGANFTPVIDEVNRYYNGSDEMVYTDDILVDMCNATTKFEVAAASAGAARGALQYPLIYTYLPDYLSSDSAYTLYMKLLMPEVFGNVPPQSHNTTTAPLLAKVDFENKILTGMKAAYAPSQQGTLKFPEQNYHLSQYSETEQQAIRLRLREILTARFAQCASSHELNPTGTCEHVTGVSNRTTVPGDLNGNTASEYTIFVPDGYTDLNVQDCVDGTDWGDFEDWLNGLRTSSSKCGKGCIIAIAVVAAFLLLLLLILLIVCISKRRRLAVVVAPKPPPTPGFSSTVDMDSEEEEKAYSNPLA